MPQSKNKRSGSVYVNKAWDSKEQAESGNRVTVRGASKAGETTSRVKQGGKGTKGDYAGAAKLASKRTRSVVGDKPKVEGGMFGTSLSVSDTKPSKSEQKDGARKQRNAKTLESIKKSRSNK